MIDVPKKIVTAEDGTPVAVQIAYEDWKRVQDVLQSLPSTDVPASDEEETFEEALTNSRGTWTGEDGLEYQRRLRSEWDRQESSSNSP
ncbi:MAG: hypothetical protein ABEL51_04415 [Salinibacter sp.]